MDAKYYRFLFQNEEVGVCHTGSIVDTYNQEKFHFVYISGLTSKVGGSFAQDPKFDKVSEIQLLVVADLSSYSVHKAVQILKDTKVGKVLLPEYCAKDLAKLAETKKNEGGYTQEELNFISNPAKYIADAGACEVLEINTDMEFNNNDWLFMVVSFGEGIDKSLVMYHGSGTIDKSVDDCVMTVKYFGREHTDCGICVEPERAECNMKCVLYNDFDVCKKHNGSEAAEYLDGTLLLGTVNLKNNLTGIQEHFKKVWKKIRFTAIPDGGNGKGWDKGILNLGTPNFKQYLICPQEGIDNGDAIRDICMNSPYQHCIVTSKQYGLCCSGFYKHRDNI